MPKLKTRKTLKKRVKISKSGKIMVGAVCNGHLKAGRSANRKGRKKGRHELKSGGFKTKFKKMLAKKGSSI